MSDRPRVRPVSLVERVATTALVPALVLLADRIPLAYVAAGALVRAKVHLSPIAIGLSPFLLGYGLVELAALVVPRWRRARHEVRGRLWLERASSAVGLVFALVQSFTMAQYLQSSELVTVVGWEPLAVHTATLAGGACATALAARWATRRGLVNGYVLWWTLPAAFDLLRGDAFRTAAIRGGAHDAVLLAVALVVPIVATYIAVAGADAIGSAARIDESAYRGDKAAAPRAWFPIPASSLQPIPCAAAILMFPALLATLGVPGMGQLQAVLQRGDLAFDVAYVALILFLMLVAAALMHRPTEVAAFVRRLGTVSEETARNDARAALRRALVPTAMYLLTLVAASMAAQGLAPGVAPSVITVAVATAVVLDLARSAVAHVRARDLVCVAVEHDAYAVGALRAALAGEGIAARPRGTAVLSLLQAFAPYAPVELHVRADDAERASGLLRHWATGESKPVAAPASVRHAEPARWSPPARAVALGALGVVALVLMRLPSSVQAPKPVRRADIAIVRVDDEADPLRAAREDDTPEGVATLAEVVPLGEGHAERRVYARVTPRRNESNESAWGRVRPWLDAFPLPPGDRWVWEPVTEPDDLATDDDARTSFHVVGLRTLVVRGEPVVTTADVEAADVQLDQNAPYEQAYVLVTLGDAGAERFYDVTREWLGRRLAILVDGHVDSAPVIKSPIRGGRISITMGAGPVDKQLADARTLAAALR